MLNLIRLDLSSLLAHPDRSRRPIARLQTRPGRFGTLDPTAGTFDSVHLSRSTNGPQSPVRGPIVGITRGFKGRHRAQRPGLPPGQYDVGNQFPVLTAEVTPRLDPERWTMTVDGLVAKRCSWTWTEMHRLPQSDYKGNIHCVTTWSKFDTTFGGVSVDVLLDLAAPLPDATHILATSTTGYTTNLPLEHVRGGRAWVVWSHEGKPLAREHGGPVRLLVPHLYFWKSAKWVTQLTLLDHDQPGFWERNGYHDLGDPWREQRYQGD